MNDAAMNGSPETGKKNPRCVQNAKAHIGMYHEKNPETISPIFFQFDFILTIFERFDKIKLPHYFFGFFFAGLLSLLFALTSRFSPLLRPLSKKYVHQYNGQF